MEKTSWEGKKFWTGLDTKEDFLYRVQTIHNKDNLAENQENKYQIKAQNIG